jgi:hypothetical protein
MMTASYFAGIIFSLRPVLLNRLVFEGFSNSFFMSGKCAIRVSSDHSDGAFGANALQTLIY